MKDVACSPVLQASFNALTYGGLVQALRRKKKKKAFECLGVWGFGGLGIWGFGGLGVWGSGGLGALEV